MCDGKAQLKARAVSTAAAAFGGVCSCMPELASEGDAGVRAGEITEVSPLVQPKAFLAMGSLAASMATQ